MSAFNLDDLRRSRSGELARSRRVLFHEVDADGLVHPPGLLRYFEDLFIELLQTGGLALPSGERGGWVRVPGRVEADFGRPLRFGDEARLALVRARAEGCAVVLGFRATVGDELVAVALVETEVRDATSLEPRVVPDALVRALAVVGSEGPPSTT